MKKLFMSLMLCFGVLLGLCALAGCAQELNETGNWKLSYFGDGEGNYAVGDDYSAKGLPPSRALFRGAA